MSELDFVDDDIAAYFRSHWDNDSLYPLGLPTQFQLARYMKRLCEIMENQRKSGLQLQPQQSSQR